MSSDHPSRIVNHALPIILLVAFCALPAPADAAPRSEDANLERYFRAYLDRSFELQPLDATQLGDRRFDDQLEDLTLEARGRWLDLTRQTLEALPTEIHYDQLSRAGQIDFEILGHRLKTEIWLTENTRPFEEDPRVYNRYVNDSVYLLLAQSTAPRETNVYNAMARMARIPAIVAAARQNLTHPPRVHTETAIRQNRGAIAFYESGLFEMAGKTRQTEELRKASFPVLEALKEYQSFLERELLSRAAGEWRLGRELFSRKLELVLDAGMTADEVLVAAETEFDRVTTEMYVLARQLWSQYRSGVPLPPDDPDGRRTAIRHVLEGIGREHGRPQDLTRDVRRTVARVKSFIRDANILELPDPDRCRIIEMPEFQRGNAVAYMNSPPPLDPDAAGYYAVSPPPREWETARVQSFMEEYNRHMLQILTIHEAYPGHYVQHEYANRNASLIRRVLPSGVYVEGWAVYTEQTMLDQGYGAADLALRLTQLKFYLRAVGNAILDHRMHCTEFTDDEALDLLVNRAFQSEGEARLKIIRAKQSSAQLSTYFVGRMAHYQLRQQLQRELGDRFNLARFHEAVLATGAVPVKYLPELVRGRLVPTP
jgi:uncharacterized protein (DUF885 family)